MFLQRCSPPAVTRSDLGHVLERGLAAPWAFDPWVSYRGPQTPPASVEQDAQGLVVRLELPGIDPDTIRVNLEGRRLTVSVEPEVVVDATAEAESESAPEGEVAEAEAAEIEAAEPRRPTRAVRARSFKLPYAVDADAVEAEARHGVLTVRLPRPASEAPRRIPVSVS